jgi:hypothetical protein
MGIEVHLDTIYVHFFMYVLNCFRMLRHGFVFGNPTSEMEGQ